MKRGMVSWVFGGRFFEGLGRNIAGMVVIVVAIGWQMAWTGKVHRLCSEVWVERGGGWWEVRQVKAGKGLWNGGRVGLLSKSLSTLLSHYQSTDMAGGCFVSEPTYLLNSSFS